MQRDWRGFLDSAFALLAERNASHLILDIRGNEGGADEVTELLLRRLLTAPPPPDSMRSFVRYVRVPDTLGVHLSTWDDAIRDLSGLVVPAAGGMHELKQDRIPPQPDASPFRGRLSMLVDEANSSATFYLADIVRRTGRGQLIGRTTGGNRKGMNGGRFFFLRLPGTGIEVDIPLVGGFPQASRPDGGIEPDIRVPLLPEDLLGGRDRDLEAALQTRLVE
jgi:C-terminal processing protease CtpA/Prc